MAEIPLSPRCPYCGDNRGDHHYVGEPHYVYVCQKRRCRCALSAGMWRLLQVTGGQIDVEDDQP